MYHSHDEYEPASWAKPGDPRVTRVGRFLRRYRIDEVPQFFNVLRGDMSLVGPRPEQPELVEKLKAQIPYYDKRHVVKPGITGWAQINYPYAATIEDSRIKLEYDLYYIKHMSLLLDLFIIAKTIKATLFKQFGH